MKTSFWADFGLKTRFEKNSDYGKTKELSSILLIRFRITIFILFQDLTLDFLSISSFILFDHPTDSWQWSFSSPLLGHSPLIPDFISFRSCWMIFVVTDAKLKPESYSVMKSAGTFRVLRPPSSAPQLIPANACYSSSSNVHTDLLQFYWPLSVAHFN